MGPWLLLLLLFPLGASGELQNEGLQCAPAQEELSAKRLFRAWSLDTTGQLPTHDQLVAIEEAGLTEGLDALLSSPGFADQVVRFHRSLLWNNISNINLFSANLSMQVAPGLSGIYYRRNRSSFYRGIAETPCLDEPATWNSTGELNFVSNGNGTIQEGWVEVSPYWAPSTVIKVCAFDAQATIVSPTGIECSSRDGWNDAACGCGPELNYCRAIGSLNNRVAQSFGESMDRSIKEWMDNDRSYLDLFRAKEMWVNGPMVHFFRHQSNLGGGVRMEPAPVLPSNLPDLHFSDLDTWVKISTHDAHSGILTHAAYLLRFQTDRARADRFYTNFLCQPFQPPEEGLPVTSEEDALNPDLQNRPGCEYCHGLLEPAAAYWGRWTETGGGFLNPLSFEAYDTDCFDCALTGTPCSSHCKDHYIVAPTSPQENEYVGWLKSYIFRDQTHYPHIEQGPELLLLTSTVNEHNPFPACSARKLAEHILRRELVPEEEPWLDQLTQDFVMGGFDYKALFKSILVSDAYRRVR